MNLQITQSYIQALTGDINSIVDFRCIHDTRKDVPAHNFRGTLQELYQTLVNYNNNGYGIFCNINALDGIGKELNNVAYIRAHIIDLDNLLTSQQNFELACNFQPAPTFGVQTSAGKYHVYWCVEPYKDNNYYSLHQRKLRQLFDGDKSVIDATRVLRVPGFYHLKDPTNPQLVQCFALNGYGKKIQSVELSNALAAVNVIEVGGLRHPLGDEKLAAPSLEWLQKALDLTDPNNLDRSEWISLTAAIKQAGWTLATPEQLFEIWSAWCAKYDKNDTGENLKQWSSIRDTEVGWPYLVYKTPIGAYKIGFTEPKTAPTADTQTATTDAASLLKKPKDFDYILSAEDCKEYFKNCYFVIQSGKIYAEGRFMNPTQFNGWKGGKQFIWTRDSKTTDEAWKAALRSTEYTIPKVDHIRFVPNKPSFEFIEDEFGRKGLNTYIKPNIKSKEGDISMWQKHMNKILPDKNDQKIFYDYLAHCVKFPGYKIPWAIVFQSTEGVGKSAFAELLTCALGESYTYSPPAQELIDSGSKFNSWMRGKLMIVVDEIKIDERRELIEILKPMITQSRIQIQAKGADQDMEDNPANWLFFTNFKDAIPINKNARRFSIFYSAFQTKADLIKHGMDTKYFTNFFNWLRKGGGYEALTHWLLNYPIKEGEISSTAPDTSSYDEVIKLGRSPVEAIIAEAVADEIVGFRGGYISTIAALNRLKSNGIRNANQKTIETVLEYMGYFNLGKANRPYMQEDVNSKSTLYGIMFDLNLENYGRAQGYE